MVKSEKPAIPGRYIVINSATHTKAIRGKGGRFKGRVYVRGVGDRTKIRQVKQDIDVDKDGTIDYQGGEIVGRTPRAIRASKRARGYIREM